MQINRLTLTNFRAFEQAEFEFQPGMNLLVGINGVGKSTVLDAIRIMLSQLLPIVGVSKSKRLDFDVKDITVECDWLYTSLVCNIAGVSLEYESRRWREKNIKHSSEPIENDDGNLPELKRLREILDKHLPQELKGMKQKDILKYLKASEQQPLALYFSTRRSLANMATPSKQSSAGNQAAAFADALTHRELRLREFAEWLLVQKALVKEGVKLAEQHLSVLNNAVTNFIDTCTGLEAIREPTTTLLLNKEGMKLDIRLFSDGERGILALILDLARRLSQANHKLENPLQDGKAIVLIDELDLHLHPRWQRTIVEKLTQTFPNCQFIATTHSPQIIGEVHPSGLILLQKEDNRVVVIQEGLQSFGLDSSWILKHLMETEPRNKTVQAQINSIEDSLEEGDLELARNQLDTLKRMIGSDDETSRFEASINNLEALADEVDSEEE
ncbi:AAA family ATPase [Planktothrix agardhii]|jgi:predicted ATP-binding protein involved in virulence|uniref:AAA family ATPase n=1 Tax=Planktothrix agardhii TaxID=1160 RepID=UPI001D0A71BB|nr:AAA family ATPase [Planktothrix agardhii]MCB8750932.1 AAA family ATPase [Planktothrix agardhii 1810]MCF3606725.1 AAA family ATPase [Planktothrix agardhii 1033]